LSNDPTEKVPVSDATELRIAIGSSSPFNATLGAFIFVTLLLLGSNLYLLNKIQDGIVVLQVTQCKEIETCE
jgi:hypothetical protein